MKSKIYVANYVNAKFAGGERAEFFTWIGSLENYVVQPFI